MFRELLFLLFGQSNCPKHDLRKRESVDTGKINRFIQRNWPIIAFIVVSLCFIVFIIACFAIVGASATDSGNLYNHLQDVI
jgi:hypothetical protein